MNFRCLWLARELPFPEDGGDRVYSARLALALAGAGADVTFAGLAAGPVPDELSTAVRWHAIGGGPRPVWRALLSAEPLQSSRAATPAYMRVVRSLLKERWDAIVLDHYGSAGLLPLMRHAQGGIGQRPLLVHVSHNHETSLWHDMAERANGPAWKRVGLWQNAVKVARSEQRLVRSVDLLACITPQDAADYADDGVRTPSLVLTPGYAGARAPQRRLNTYTPRHVVLVGAFRWVVKQENLRALLSHAADTFARHGIVLDIVGDMPQALRQEIGVHPAVRVHGFVDDLAPLLADARIALVPEAIGGGFKLKLLDYVFHRVPVATLQASTAGLPPALADAMLCCADLPSLVDAVLTHIDDVEQLDRLQRAAYDAADAAFDWADRGRLLLQTMRSQVLAGVGASDERSDAGQPHSSRYSSAQFSGDSRYPPVINQPTNSATRSELEAVMRVRQ
jgi:glycosyltransferase involved in cell wall biosynthesis